MGVGEWLGGGDGDCSGLTGVRGGGVVAVEKAGRDHGIAEPGEATANFLDPFMDAEHFVDDDDGGVFAPACRARKIAGQGSGHQRWW